MATWLERSGGFTKHGWTPLRAHAALPASGQSRSIGTSWDAWPKGWADARAAKAELPVRRLKGEPHVEVLIATDWLAACAGCHMSLLDMDERIVELLNT